MILAVTDHDEATRSNALTCVVLHNPATPQLLGAAVSGGALINLVALHPAMPVLFVGHGRRNACIGSDSEALLSIDDVACVSDRTVFSLACHTGSELGQAAAAGGGTWIGFVGAISCLLDDAGLVEHFRRIPIFIRDRLPTVTGIATADAFVTDFVALCESIDADLIEADAEDMGALIALRWYMERIRAWLPGEVAPRAPAGATEPALL